MIAKEGSRRKDVSGAGTARPLFWASAYEAGLARTVYSVERGNFVGRAIFTRSRSHALANCSNGTSLYGYHPPITAVYGSPAAEKLKVAEYEPREEVTKYSLLLPV